MIPSLKARLFRVNFDAAAGGVMLQVTDHTRWLCIPAAPVGPKRLSSFSDLQTWPILWKQNASASPLLKFKLNTKHKLTVEELRRLCEQAGLPVSGDKAALLERLAWHCCAGDSANDRTAYVGSVINWEAAVDEEVVDELTEQAWENLDADDKGEFKEVEEIPVEAANPPGPGSRSPALDLNRFGGVLIVGYGISDPQSIPNKKRLTIAFWARGRAR